VSDSLFNIEGVLVSPSITSSKDRLLQANMYDLKPDTSVNFVLCSTSSLVRFAESQIRSLLETSSTASNLHKGVRGLKSFKIQDTLQKSSDVYLRCEEISASVVDVVTKHAPIILTADSNTYVFPGPILHTCVLSSPHGFAFREPVAEVGYASPYVYDTGNICYNGNRIWRDARTSFNTNTLNGDFAQEIVKALRQAHRLLGRYTPSCTPVTRLNEANFGGYKNAYQHL
jgi:hypothetical protein